MKYLTIIGGVPAVGKTTLMRAVIKELGFHFVCAEGLVKYLQFPDPDGFDTYIIGDYTAGEMFDGTDRLSMAVQPQFINIMTRNPDEPPSHTIMEGDRLFNQSLFDALQPEVEAGRLTMRIIILRAAADVLTPRVANRVKAGSTQPEKFRLSRATKVRNVMENNKCLVWRNQNNADLERNVRRILGWRALEAVVSPKAG